MPMTINVGLSKKVGEANYGSRGASVSFQVEVESTLVREPEQLHDKVRYLFRLAEEAVEEELGGHDQHDDQRQAGNGQNGNGSQRPTNGRRATASQVRAIHAIANRNRVDLPSRLQAMFSVDQPGDLSISEASQAIDDLKSQGGQAGGRR